MPIFNGIEFNETQNLHINNQISNYVLGIFDPSKLIIMNLATANTVTIPNDSSVDFLIGTRIYVLQSGVGQTSILASLGVTINSQSGILSLASQYCMCELIKTASNTWTLQGGIIPPPIPATNYGLFAQTANSTPITATTTEGTLINGGVGTLFVPANGFSVGDSFQANFGGVMSAQNNQTITIRVKSGSVILATSGAITLPSITNQVWNLILNFTIRSIGAAGVASIVSLGEYHILKFASGTQEGYGFNTVNNTTFDTTISNTLDVTAQWGSNNAGNSIYSDIFILNKVY
jgi:hypothetical protein